MESQSVFQAETQARNVSIELGPCGSISAHEEFEESFRPCSKEGRRAGGRAGGRSDLDILALLLEEGFGSFPGEDRLRFLGGESIEKNLA